MNSKLTLVTDSLKNLSEAGSSRGLFRTISNSTETGELVDCATSSSSSKSDASESQSADPFPPCHPTANLPLVGQAQVQPGHPVSQLSAPSKTIISPPENTSVDPRLLAQPTPTLPDMGHDKLQQPLLSHSMSKSMTNFSSLFYLTP